MRTSAIQALIAAALFGASTPLAKRLAGEVEPLLLGGLLYLGSGIGLALARVVRDRGWRASGIRPGEGRWLFGAVGFGGLLAPAALMWGLARTSASSASLLLNLESVLTALLAWFAFGERAGRRVVCGMVAIAAGGALLAWPGPGAAAVGAPPGLLAIALACLFWAMDNNLTRRVAQADALFVAASKGLVAGPVNCALALALGAHWPGALAGAATMAVGLFGYGVSLVLFVLALRGIGAARTGAYFSVAPFIGAAIAVPLLGEAPPAAFWFAGALMALGVWLHLSEPRG